MLTLVLLNVIPLKNVQAADTNTQTYYDRHPEQVDSFLGAAAHFNVFAHNVHLITDTNGNVAAQNFYPTQQAFDIWRGRNEADLLNNDDDYIQNMVGEDRKPAATGSGVSPNTGNNKTSYLALGKNIPYNPAGTDGKPTINGVKNDQINASQIYQDTDQEYIDFDQEFSKLEAANQELAKYPVDVTVDSNDQFNGQGKQGTDFVYGDQNNRVIDVSTIDKQAVVIKINAEVLKDTLSLNILGLEAANSDGSGKEVFIVVDGAGSKTIDIGAKVKLYYADSKTATENHDQGDAKTDNAGKTEHARQETELMSFTDSTILWSFTSTNGEDSEDVTNINIHSPWIGSILAPKATLNGTGVNLQGSMMVDTYVGSGSLYRWDWQGTLSPKERNNQGINLTIEKFDAKTKQLISETESLASLTYSLTNTATGESIDLTAANNWTAENLTGTYTIEEKTAPEGYTVDPMPQQFTIDENNQVQSNNQAVSSAAPTTSSGLYLKDAQLVYRQYDTAIVPKVNLSLNLLKYDQSTKKAIDDKTGLAFEIKKYQDATFNQVVDSNVEVSEDFTTTLATGSYSIKEISAPKGYTVNDDLYYFTVADDGSVISKEKDKKLKTNWQNSFVAQAETNTDTLYQAGNQLYFQKFDAPAKPKISKTLNLLKYDKSDQTKIDKLAGLTFTITRYLDNTYQQIVDTQEITSDYTTKLSAGSYRVVESAAPKGYEKEDAPYDFTINEDGSVTTANGSIKTWKKALATHAETNEDSLYQSGDQLYFQKFDVQKTKKIQLLKYNKLSQNRIKDLTNLSFEIIQSQNHKELKRVVVKGNELNDYTASLSYGFDYTLKELTAPNGYQLDTTSYDFTINEDGTVTTANGSIKTWKNALLTHVETNKDSLYQSGNQLYFQKFDEIKPLTFQIFKYDKKTKEQLSDLTDLSFELTQFEIGKDGKTIKTTKITGTNILDYLVELTPGYDYELKEIAAPKGYKVEDSKYDFSIDADGAVTADNGKAVSNWQSTIEKKAVSSNDQLYQKDDQLYFQKFDEEKPISVPLPHTGGSGKMIFFSTGIGLLLIALILDYIRRKIYS